jgi:hypothetical protein
MIKSYTLLPLLLISLWGAAQDDEITVFELNNTYIAYQDTSLFFSSFGKSVAGTVVDNDNVLTTDVMLLLRLLGQGTTGQRDILPVEGIVVYPNPVLHTLILETAGRGELDVQIFHLDGRSSYCQRWSDNEVLAIPLAQYATGVYILRVSEPGTARMSSYKIVKH